MIGPVPCRVASEVHVDGRHIAQAGTVQETSGKVGVHTGPETSKMPKQKHTLVMTAEGREVMGSRHSTCKLVTKKDVAESSLHGEQRTKGVVGQDCVKVHSARTDLGGIATRGPRGTGNPCLGSGLRKQDTNHEGVRRRCKLPGGARAAQVKLKGAIYKSCDSLSLQINEKRMSMINGLIKHGL
jgi:hypothetical protein